MKTPIENKPAELIADAVVRIAASMKELDSTRLTRRALVALIHDHSGVAKKTIGIVLNNLSALEDIWLKPDNIHPPHQQRVINEKMELDSKARNLSAFIGENPIFDTLTPEEQERMKVQNNLMWQYSAVLSHRIAAFTTPKK